MAKQERVKIMKHKDEKRNTLFWGWALIGPTFIGLLILNIIPVIQSLVYSFHNVSTFGENTFVGLSNYMRMLNDALFWQSLGNTFLYTIVQVPITIGISLVLAALLNTKIKGLTIYRAIYFMPMIAAPAAVAVVWRWLLNSEYGLVNQILGANIQWLSDPNIVIWSVIIVGIWSNIGYSMILLLAGLQEIPKLYYEAAEVDGASKVYQFFHITVPLLTPQIFFVAVTSVIQALQVFDIIYIMFDDINPSFTQVQTVVVRFFHESFVLNDKGYGSAIIMALVIIIMILTAIQWKLQDKWVTYD
ncbi:sugar ABC transporter permease [Dolosigranulum pigrum]|nr:sugar ABC transporter permease [Dolosigranulum pigrum]RAN51008.1 sugar ABC transporter permease [Dolosigranulum pigrum]